MMRAASAARFLRWGNLSPALLGSRSPPRKEGDPRKLGAWKIPVENRMSESGRKISQRVTHGLPLCG